MTVEQRAGLGFSARRWSKRTSGAQLGAAFLEAVMSNLFEWDYEQSSPDRTVIHFGDIDWYSLAVSTDGSKELLIARESIGDMPFEDEDKCDELEEADEPLVWANSTIREYLNGPFLETHFTPQERQQIVEATIRNDDNPDSGVVGGGPTKDRVFLLSQFEADLLAYGYEFEGNDWFWLRSPGDDMWSPAFLCFDEETLCEAYDIDCETAYDAPDSYVLTDGDGATECYGILPVMWVHKA